jgi:hypothetical protein
MDVAPMVDRKPLTWYRDHEQLVLSGCIDERAKLVDLVGHARDGRLALDCAHVSFINSIGVREWIRMQATAAAMQVRLELRRVCEPIIHQLNIVPAARGVSLVSSFFAPYECDECELEYEMLLDVTTHGKLLARGQPPALPCPECKELMQLAHPPELYLGFLVA